MAIHLGSTLISDLFLGSVRPAAVYLGAQLVWPSDPGSFDLIDAGTANPSLVDWYDGGDSSVSYADIVSGGSSA